MFLRITLTDTVNHESYVYTHTYIHMNTYIKTQTHTHTHTRAIGGRLSPSVLQSEVRQFYQPRMNEN